MRGLRRFPTKPLSYLVEPQNQDWKLVGRRRDPGVPRSFDAGGCVAGSQGLHWEDRSAATVWPCDEEECYMTYLPLRGLYQGVAWSFAWLGRDSYILALGFPDKPSIQTASHFLAP
jgi:hypothetical protein